MSEDQRTASATIMVAQSPLFEGLMPSELETVLGRMRVRRFAAGDELCRAGEEPDRIWLITGGLVKLWAAKEGVGEIELRCHRGDVVGHLDAFSGGARTASAAASTVTTTLEMDARDLFEVAHMFPRMLINVIRGQRERLLQVGTRGAGLSLSELRGPRAGEEIAIVAGASLKAVLPGVIAAARSASPQGVKALDRSLSFAGALTASDELGTGQGTVLIPSELDLDTLGVLLDEVDRVVALVSDPRDVERLGQVAAAHKDRRLEIVLVSDEARNATQSWRPGALGMIVRECQRQPGFPLTDVDVAWLARHLTRTKLGIALGAGGAKGYAHVGVLKTLEQAGYTVDYVGGSSIGGFVATQVALGYDAATIDERFRVAFSPENTEKLFSSPLVGAAGLELLTAMLKQATDGRSFNETAIPLVIMAVDLTDRVPVQQRQGRLWEALLAALSVAGVFPTQERNGHRLIDAIALVPVPTTAVVDDGADIVVSVNLMGAATLQKWPGVIEPEEAEPQKQRRRGPLDTILEAMDLSQTETSARDAGQADVTVTPRFGPCEWRDFQLADRFLEAGREAALAQLRALKALSRPVDLSLARRSTSLT